MSKAPEHLLAELFRRYHRELSRFAARMVGDRTVGEEVAQDAYAALMRVPQFAAVDFPKTYLFATVRNIALDLRDRRRTEWNHRAEHHDLPQVESPAADQTTALYHRQRLQALADALNQLPSACRRAFVMNKIEGRKHRDIAAELGISVSMVEKHVMRALVHCREVLQETDAP